MNIAEPTERMALLSPPPLALSRLTFREVERELARLPALILPLGGCEPYSGNGAMGTASACATALAAALSSQLGIMVAPTLEYGVSTAYTAFAGCAGVRPRTLTNILCETARIFHFQGFRLIVIVDCLADNDAALDLAVRRLKARKSSLTVVPFPVQRSEHVRAFVGKRLKGKELGRAEFGMLSMAAFIDRTLVRESKNGAGSVAKPPDAERFRIWRKRGADPQQFRKMFPEASASNHCGESDAFFGRELFGYILQLLEESVAPFLAPLRS